MPKTRAAAWEQQELFSEELRVRFGCCAGYRDSDHESRHSRMKRNVTSFAMSEERTWQI